MRMYIALLILVVAWNVHAEVYKCQDPRTGVVEYSDRECEKEEFSLKINTVTPGSGKKSDGKALFRSAYEKKLENELENYCKIFFRDRGYTDIEFNSLCKRASDRYIDCAIEKQINVYPDESNQALFKALEDGKNLAEAKEVAREVHNKLVPSEEIRKRIHEKLQVQIRDCLVFYREENKE